MWPALSSAPTQSQAVSQGKECVQGIPVPCYRDNTLILHEGICCCCNVLCGDGTVVVGYIRSTDR